MQTMSIRDEVLSRLKESQIPFSVHFHDPVSTMEDCLALPFVNDEIMFCKNILLCNRQKTDFYLYLTPPDKPFRTADVSKKLQTARLSFAPQDILPQLLHLESGSLSPFGLWWDAAHQVTLVVDSEIRSVPYLAFHPCDHTATVVLSQDAFFHQVIPALGSIMIELSVPRHSV